jgi:hypothetical protein
LVRLEHASDAPRLLAAICRRFSAGFDTPDLIETKALLED